MNHLKTQFLTFFGLIVGLTLGPSYGVQHLAKASKKPAKTEKKLKETHEKSSRRTYLV